ncbi:unnamed protein product [Allacma fusca]|uniref:Uncharacterized protein n=1 Tax=Allacma fusca TaxID=39272 RepID=A0A8J2K2W3_9HEXA|nr:unnamed protein product [Allacma fusca]
MPLIRSTQEVTRGTAKGTKPLPEPTTISEILTKVLVYGCKKYLFLESKYRLMGYAVLLFFVALVADFLPFPKTYFSNSSNILNQLFVKYSWAWTLSLVGIFVFLTTSVYCAGDTKKILRHFSRLLIATLVWWTWTKLFVVLEDAFGSCKTKPAKSGDKQEVMASINGKRACYTKNGTWVGFDVSGHAFLLIWCVMVITEEAKAILGWDSIKDYIRHEDHNRRRTSLAGTSGLPTDLFSETPLSRLSSEEFDKVKKAYNRFTIFANISVVSLTALALLWDGMLIATAIYFHSMIEKVLAGLIAGLMWYTVYQCFYTWDILISPGLPGFGLFKYSPEKSFKTSSNLGSNKASTTSASALHFQTPGKLRPRDQDVPQFMGMPLNALKNKAKGDGISSSLDVSA